jgi:hypothetical protein
VLATPEFAALKRQVLDLIHEESVLALEHAGATTSASGRATSA